MADPDLRIMSEPAETEAAGPTETERVIAARRTSLVVDPDRLVPDDLVDRLITAATWAPNHKRTWPWHFTVLTGDSRARLGEAMAALGADIGLPEQKVTKLRTKYLRSPAALLVWADQSADDEVRRREDRDAVAAATQNLLLTATAHGLSSYWGTVADRLVPAVRRVADVEPDRDLMALVYLGWPIGEVVAPERPPPDVTRLR